MGTSNDAMISADSPAASPGACPLDSGEILAGRYRIGGLLGAGAFGWVFAATDNSAAGRVAAIKVLRPERATPAELRRFRDRELALLLRVQRVAPSTNVVRVLEPRTMKHAGFHYLVLELVEGRSLRELIQRGHLDPLRIRRIGAGIARGLSAIHAAGGVHRDLKPDNIRLRGGVEPVIVDLGIAKSTWEPQHITETGARPMTPRYAAPEQLAGEEVVAASDVYALGLMLCEMLTGDIPAGGTTQGTKLLTSSRRHTETGEIVAGDIAEDTAAQALRCLESDPKRRPSAMELARVLSDRPARQGRWSRPGRRALVGGLLLLLVLLGVFGSYQLVRAPWVHPEAKPIAARWRMVGSLRSGRIKPIAIPLEDGRVMMSTGNLVQSQVYDPTTEAWSIPKSQGQTSGHTPFDHVAATLLVGGKVFFAGDGRADHPDRTTVYDPATDTWARIRQMNTPRDLCSATLLADGGVLVVGGHSEGLPSAEIYDPATNGWTTTASMNVGRSGHTATLLLDGRVLVTGGYSSKRARQTRAVGASAELYDPAADTWTPAASMTAIRHHHTATRLKNGKVLVVGGVSGGHGNQQAIASAELYDPATDTWIPAGSTKHARAEHTATLLANGEVLVVGGHVNLKVAEAELYDPATNGWSSAGMMSVVRKGCAAARLPNGGVLVTGGVSDGPESALATSEVYEPGEVGGRSGCSPGGQASIHGAAGGTGWMMLAVLSALRLGLRARAFDWKSSLRSRPRGRPSTLSGSST